MTRKKRCALFCLAAALSVIAIIFCTLVDQNAEAEQAAEVWRQTGALQETEEILQNTEEPLVNAGQYMFVWMSDTQAYSGYAPEIYSAMTEWIVLNAGEKDIKFVFHTGDIVDHSDSEEEWKNADIAMKNIDGAVPYSILAGNHDLLEEGDEYAAYLSHFGPDRFAGQENIQWYGEGEASAQVLHTGGRSYLILALGFNPDRAVINWANQVLAGHREIPAILTTHNYLHEDGTLSTAGRELYQEIVLKNPNVHLVLCGHNHSAEKRIAEIDDDGDGVTDRTVYQLLADYQDTPGGGNGYMRLLMVDEEKKTLQVTTYSPVLDDYHYFSTVEYPEKDEFCIDISDWF